MNMEKLKFSFGNLRFSFSRSQFVGTSVVHSHSGNFSFSANIEQRLYYATQEQPLDPWWVTGFTEAEGCFHVYINNAYPKIGKSAIVSATFQIIMHKRDKALLQDIKSYFVVGNISKQGSQSIQFRVRSIKDLAVIIDHLDKYPLITEKLADYKLLKQAFKIVERKEHLTAPGGGRLQLNCSN